MSEKVLRLLVVAYVATIALLFMVLVIADRFAIPVIVNTIVGLLFVLVLFSGLFAVPIYSVKVRYVRMKERDQKRFEAFMKGHPSEKVLGCIRVRRMTGSLLMASEAQELFLITPDKAFVVGVAEVTPRPGMEYSYSVTTVPKADETIVPNSEIRKVELKAYLLGLRVRLSIVTREKEYKWWTWGLVPDRKDAKLEDYESVLRPAFGDKLSVKK